MPKFTDRKQLELLSSTQKTGDSIIDSLHFLKYTSQTTYRKHNLDTCIKLESQILWNKRVPKRQQNSGHQEDPDINDRLDSQTGRPFVYNDAAVLSV